MDFVFELLPLLLIIWVTAGSGKKKKKAGKQRRRSRRSGRSLEDVLGGAMQKAAEHRTAEPDSDMREADCEAKPIHLHSVSQQTMRSAGEGEDPCHAGNSRIRTEEIGETPVPQDADNVLAQDVLRGVIMSEILTRPRDRVAMRRRENHG